ncbi:DUF2089 domain-containing protein [Christensenellaceae bacterium OttesenSCG-928-M15]|nr:DUF2089 domain-containing protein [Christensenellaceae bacterium OttesenSCG-928-M15]
MMEKYNAPASCPVCRSTMQITRLSCRHCATELTGTFEPCRFCKLEDKHLEFVLTFLRCRGNIKEMEKALKVSYPTVRNMMDAALKALELDDRPDSEIEPVQNPEREEILNKLSEGTIDVAAAIKALGGTEE